jgi:chromosome segregation ATPase
VQKSIFILIFLINLFTFFGCRGTPAVDNSQYTETIIRLQRRIDSLGARNSELEARLGELIEDNQRYAEYYRSATAAVRSSLESADGKAGSLEERIDRLLRINDLLTELVQQIADGEYGTEGGEQGTEGND